MYVKSDKDIVRLVPMMTLHDWFGHRTAFRAK